MPEPQFFYVDPTHVELWGVELSEDDYQMHEILGTLGAIKDTFIGPVLAATQIGELLARFTYKPGWRFELVSDFDALGWALSVDFPAPHAMETGEWTVVHSVYRVPWILSSEEHFWIWLQGILKEVEFHELREFFKVDGVALWRPH